MKDALVILNVSLNRSSSYVVHTKSHHPIFRIFLLELLWIPIRGLACVNITVINACCTFFLVFVCSKRIATTSWFVQNLRLLLLLMYFNKVSRRIRLFLAAITFVCFPLHTKLYPNMFI